MIFCNERLAKVTKPSWSQHESVPVCKSLTNRDTNEPGESG